MKATSNTVYWAEIMSHLVHVCIGEPTRDVDNDSSPRHSPATAALPGLHAAGYLAHYKALLSQDSLLH